MTFTRYEPGRHAGPIPAGWWRCCDCHIWRAVTGPGELAALRDEAIGHLRVSGHRVEVVSAWAETLYPLDTQATRGELTR